jgi:hypothetical protein
VRIVLEPDDFALSSGEEPPPSDLIDKDTWQGITTLTDDVSIRTSNHHGRLLKTLYTLWGAWIESIGENQDYLFDTILDAADEFQAATFNALNGYYRQAIGCLRSALELITIGTYCQVCAEAIKYKEWRQGKKIGFGEACDKLRRAAPVKALELHLDMILKDSIFAPINLTPTGGWARRLYSALSDYSHTRPGFASGDMWASNGPIYVGEAFISTAEMYLQVSALCFIMAKLARPNFVLPKDARQVFESPKIQQIKIAHVAYEYLFRNKG